MTYPATAIVPCPSLPVHQRVVPQTLTMRIMPGFHHSVAVSPFSLRKFRENYVSAVRIAFLREKFCCAVAVARTCRCAVTAVP